TNAAGHSGDEQVKQRPRETMKLPVQELEENEVAPADEPTPVRSDCYGADDEDDEATIQRETIQATPSSSQPRKSTLAMAIVRPRTPSQPDVAAEEVAGPSDVEPEYDEYDGIADEVDEWSVADQPTIQLPPRMARPSADFLTTGDHKSWPLHAAAPVSIPYPGRPPVRPSFPRREPIARPAEIQGARLAGPDGRRVPPPAGVSHAIASDPRMKRFQELEKRRVTPSSPQEDQPVTEAVRQWWSDLRPGLQRALRHQHEARASGTFPIPAHEPVPSSRLGDAFGRLGASARGLTEKAQAVAGPAIKRLHDQAEQAAQAIIERFEGSAMRQQEPFLGPGRIAIFFRSGVTVGQAQRLLSASQARPMRIIPRKHGFLAYVKPGFEVEISERLRLHPYVRDVLYVDYDEYGDTVEQEDEEQMP
ncbi:MAG TPA: hypothetical protein VGP82_01945, partial [Ktedonobacterales bacterium]|nr:hypothetical protein [Ktedonobacterales bacterium]